MLARSNHAAGPKQSMRFTAVYQCQRPRSSTFWTQPHGFGSCQSGSWSSVPFCAVDVNIVHHQLLISITPSHTEDEVAELAHDSYMCLV